METTTRDTLVRLEVTKRSDLLNYAAMLTGISAAEELTALALIRAANRLQWSKLNDVDRFLKRSVDRDSRRFNRSAKKERFLAHRYRRYSRSIWLSFPLMCLVRYFRGYFLQAKPLQEITAELGGVFIRLRRRSPSKVLADNWIG